MFAKAIKVFAPATVANLASGFDIMGLAIHKPGDELVMQLNNSGKVKLNHLQVMMESYLKTLKKIPPEFRYWPC